MKEREVRHYYNQNTRGFLRYGGSSKRTSNLHRSLRLPSLRGEDETHAVHHLILDAFARHGLFDEAGSAEADGERRATRSRRLPATRSARPFVADLGCGVGASMQWMLSHAEVDIAGITVSEVQARIATARLGRHARVQTGSFSSQADIAGMTSGRRIDAAYMIESFVHADGPDRLFDILFRHSSPGALLIVCDDLPTRELLELTRSDGRPRVPGAGVRKRARLLAGEFRRGWHIHTFESPDDLARRAREHGWELAEETDLSRYVNTNRPRDAGARIFAPIARLLGLNGSFWQNIIGGGALQRLIRRGLVKYELLVFRRSDEAGQ